MNFDLLPPQVVTALEAGNKVEAIKQLRLAKGMSFEEAKAVIDAHGHSGMLGLEDLRPPSASNVAGKLVIPPEAVAALRRGDWIGAIKVLREMKGVGLAEAKTALEQLKRQMPKPVSLPRSPLEALHAKGLSPGEVPHGVGAHGGAWIALVVALVVILWALQTG